jgi:hypothetical protein
MNVSDSSKTKSTAVPLVETADEKERNPIGSDEGVKTEAEQQDPKEVAGSKTERCGHNCNMTVSHFGSNNPQQITRQLHVPWQ